MAKTVFILGAGASMNFGLPDGAGLSRSIAAYLATASSALDMKINDPARYQKEEESYRTFMNEFLGLFSNVAQEQSEERALKLVQPMSRQIPLAASIDSYVANAFEDQKQLVKALIVQNLLKSEANCRGDVNPHAINA